jgi:hypothetical protein
MKKEKEFTTMRVKSWLIMAKKWCGLANNLSKFPLAKPGNVGFIKA